MSNIPESSVVLSGDDIRATVGRTQATETIPAQFVWTAHIKINDDQLLPLLTINATVAARMIKSLQCFLAGNYQGSEDSMNK